MNDHPTREQLRRWLEGDDNLDMGHIEACDQCLSDLEELSRLDDVLVRTFAQVTRPSPGFADRVVAAIEHRQRFGEAMSVATDLFSLGWRTIDTVWDGDG